MKKIAFTLAEIMIVLTVIGVLSAILLPVAINSSPDEKVMKFKKGHATFFKIVNELINSDKYFLPGDFSYYPDGRELDNPSYLCASMADLVTTKEVNCNTGKDSNPRCLSPWAEDDLSGEHRGIALVVEVCDIHCAEVEEGDNIQAYFITADGITYYDENADTHFASLYCPTCSEQWVIENVGHPKRFKQTAFFNGLEAYRAYKCICMDIDGVNRGEPPFGYGLRVDGKIVIGSRAQEWLQKSFSEKE